MSHPGPDAAAIVASAATTSDKIRALNAAGYPRAEIARMLGKRYQHVRNVLEDDKAREVGTPPQLSAYPGPGVAEAQADFERKVEARAGGYYRFVLGTDGSLILPREVREALRMRDSRVVVGHLDGETFTLIGPEESIRRIQEMARQYIQPGVSLVDELIADRRAEVAREEADG